jgi:1,4-dihydroxy-2-naphthoate octaprenyltransferase
MNSDTDINEIEQLEKQLNEFKNKWNNIQSQKAKKWRVHFFISFIVAIALSLLFSNLWWVGIGVIGYFAGSLYTMLRLNAKTSKQINEHQNQLKLVRLLRNFEASPYSK